MSLKQQILARIIVLSRKNPVNDKALERMLSCKHLRLTVRGLIGNYYKDCLITEDGKIHSLSAKAIKDFDYMDMDMNMDMDIQDSGDNKDLQEINNLYIESLKKIAEERAKIVAKYTVDFASKILEEDDERLIIENDSI